MNFKIVEVDISNCHTRIVASIFKKETPLLNKLFYQNESLWPTSLKVKPIIINTF